VVDIEARAGYLVNFDIVWYVSNEHVRSLEITMQFVVDYIANYNNTNKNLEESHQAILFNRLGFICSKKHVCKGVCDR